MTKCIPVIEVGVTALRDPITREFLPAEPLYIEKTERAEESEAALMQDVRKLFAQRIQRYTSECGKIGDKTTADALCPDAGQPAKSAAAPDKPRKTKSRTKKKGTPNKWKSEI